MTNSRIDSAVKTGQRSWAATLALAALAALPGCKRNTAPTTGAAPAVVDAGPPPRVQVSTGYNHGCARLIDGTVRCWGTNNAGQLGDGTQTLHNAPTAVPGLSNVTQIATGMNYSCALTGNGTVQCWGDNQYRQLGDGTTTERHTPTPVQGVTAAARIACETSHCCAAMRDGTARCWGSNSSGCLGDGTPGTPRDGSVAVAGIAGARDVAVGGGFSCALLRDGSVQCWGDNREGSLGDGTTTAHLAPAPVAGLSGVAQISARETTACARLADGSLRCWGGNDSGQVGDGTQTNRPSATAVTGIAGASDVTVGRGAACAVLADGSARCWGMNSSYRFGTAHNGADLRLATPTALDEFHNVVDLSVSGSWSCSVDRANAIHCSGNNEYSQLGVGSSNSTQVPLPVQL